MNAIEEKLYEIAGEELATKNVNRGLWTRAFSLALGDEAKTKAVYIELLRVTQLREQITDEIEFRKQTALERALPEDDRVRHRLHDLASVPFEDTDHIPADQFTGHPQALSHPVAVSHAAHLSGMLEFQIIDLIKRGYLRGVRCGDDWYFDLERSA